MLSLIDSVKPGDMVVSGNMPDIYYQEAGYVVGKEYQVVSVFKEHGCISVRSDYGSEDIFSADDWIFPNKDT